MVFSKINLFINMASKINTLKVLEEKLKYVIRGECNQRNFTVLEMDIEMDTVAPNETTLEEYRVYIKVDYNGFISSKPVSSFAKSIINVCAKLDECLSQYTLSKDGKLVTENNNIKMSSAIWSIEYEIDESNIMFLSYKFTYPE